MELGAFIKDLCLRNDVAGLSIGREVHARLRGAGVVASDENPPCRCER